jgi:putative ABC transport system permease protein
MSRLLRPPALALWVLERVLPEPTRSEVIGDLSELLAADGRARQIRFWGRALVFAGYFLAARLLAAVGDTTSGLLQPGWRSDAKYAWKALSRAPGFTLTAITTLTLAVAGVTTVAAVAGDVLWRPLPFPGSEALVVVDWRDTAGHAEGSTLHEAELLRRHATRFVAAGVFTAGQRELHVADAAELVSISYVHSGTLAALGIQPVIGRLFDASHDRVSGDVHYAIVSHGLWQRRLGADRDLSSRHVRIGTQRLTVIGVMPPDFDFPSNTDVWVPVESFWASSGLAPRMRADVRLYPVLGRLAPGATIAQAAQELDAIATASTPNAGRERPEARVRAFREVFTAELVAPLRGISAGVLGLLLMCGVNVAGLHIARASRRLPEFLARQAMGAPRGRLLRSLAMEAAFVCLAAALLGGWLATAALRTLAASGVLDLPTWVQLEPDASVWSMAVVVSALATLIASTTPIRYLTRARSAILGPLSGRGGSPDRARARQALVLAQVALSTTQVAGTFMLLASVRQLQTRDVGIRTDGVLTVSVTRSAQGNRVQRSHLLWGSHQRVVERLAAVPGVSRVTGGDRLPLAGALEPRTTADLQVSAGSGSQGVQAVRFRAADVFPGYFETLGIPILHGRGVDTGDTVDRASVVVVNAYAATRLWPGRDPLGQQVRWGPARPDNPAATVVGVVGDVRHATWETEPGIEFYYPYAQYATDVTHYVLQASNAAGANLAETIRQAILEVSPETVVSEIRTMDEWRRTSLAEHTAGSTLLSLLSLVALALAIMGLYALVAYFASERATEFAIRTSLGATPRALTHLVLSSIIYIVAVGIGVGLTSVYALQRVLRPWLFGVTAGDPQLVLGTCVVMILVALGATLLPALRAGRANPAQLFR